VIGQLFSRTTLSTDEKPSAGSLTALVDQVKTAGVPAIFAESTTNPDLITSVARDAGVVVAP
jgi:manganese/iron transport system substrate-binding protein